MMRTIINCKYEKAVKPIIDIRYRADADDYAMFVNDLIFDCHEEFGDILGAAFCYARIYDAPVFYNGELMTARNYEDMT